MARVVSSLDIMRVAAFNELGDDGDQYVDHFGNELARLGGKLVWQEDLPDGTTKFTAFLAKARALGAQAIYAVGLSDSGICQARVQMQNNFAYFLVTDGATGSACGTEPASAAATYGTEGWVDPTVSSDPAVMAVVNAYRKAYPNPKQIVQYTFAGCPPILSYASYARPGCQGFNANVFNVIDKYRIDTVVMSARWDELRQRGLLGLKETVARLKAKGVKVYVLGQSPMFGFDVAVLDYRAAGERPDGSSSWLASFDPVANEHLRSESSAGTFIDPLSSFCRGRTCQYKSSEGLLFGDYGHFSDLGSDFAVRSYFPLYRAGASSTAASLGR